MADQAADRGQRLQMLGAGVGRRQQQEDEVDRRAVDRLVIDRRRKPRDQRIDPIELVQLAVRDGDAAAKAGRAQPLALGDRIGDLRRIERQARGGDLRQLVQQLALVARGQVDADRFEIEKLGKLHRLIFQDRRVRADKARDGR